MPPPDLFPISSITLNLANGERVAVEGIPGAQQYNMTLDGNAGLREWATALTSRQQCPACETETVLTSGSNSALSLLSMLFLERGDCIAVEEFHYPVLVEGYAVPEGVDVLSVAMDAQGAVPEALDATLADRCRRGEALPKFLYTIPVAQNPTGSVASQERIREVYRVCAKYGLLIVEDDPYYFLQYPEGPDRVPGSDLAPGYLSVDRDGRVIRVDTLSKIVAPGLRLGWVTCAPAIAKKLRFATATVSTGVCGVSAAVALSLVKAWGSEGFEAHTRKTQAHYAAKAAACDAAAKRYLSELADWETPSAGMFMWVRLRGVDSVDSAALLEAMRDERVIAVPASAVSASDNRPYLRIAYSYGEQAQIEEGLRRLAVSLRRFLASAKKE